MSSIAVFDSGFGGLTVLKRLQMLMPEEHYIYYGDSANAPYGDKSAGELAALTSAVCERLLQEDEIKCFVIACNTTTSEAWDALLARFPDQLFVGIEPALLPAVRENPGKKILVLGTTATVRGKRLQKRLLECEGRAEISVYAATGIVPYVEGQRGTPEAFRAYLEESMAAYAADTDCVVLGCTHFPFVKEELRACFRKDIRFYDAAEEVAGNTKALLTEHGLLNPPGTGPEPVTFLNSDPAKIAAEAALLLRYHPEAE